MVLARFYFNAEQPDAETLGQAVWLHKEMMTQLSLAVQSGVAKAFSK